MVMPRQARLDAPGVLHHVMARGIERGVIFRDNADREDFVRRLAQAAESGKIAVCCPPQKVPSWGLIEDLFPSPPIW